MNWKYQIAKNGFIRTTDESGKTHLTRPPNSDSKEMIDMCLNCAKKKCNGNCNEIRRKRNETENRNY